MPPCIITIHPESYSSYYISAYSAIYLPCFTSVSLQLLSFCRDFEKETCRRLLKPPYVCNGCGKRSVCSLEKRVYNADFAHREYRDILSEPRTGLSYSEDEIRYLDAFISPLIRQNQSPHHICVNNADSLTVSERTIYRLIDARIISAMNIDLPRKVRYSAHKVECHLKVDKACRIGRTYVDFKGYLLQYPDLSITAGFRGREKGQ